MNEYRYDSYVTSLVCAMAFCDGEACVCDGDDAMIFFGGKSCV